MPFETVLVANRGEIAVRVFRTLRSLGIRGVAVHSDADAGAVHTRSADVAVRIGGEAPADSYLHIERIVEAALATGAQAVHPGYGFLSENHRFAEAVVAAGLTFVGPPAAAMLAMGDKVLAKRTVAAAGVRVVPGRAEPGLDDAALVAVAEEIGFPVMVKPSAGGGGKGMHVVHRADDLPPALVAARREASRSFGDDTLLVERFVPNPRHIEVQVLADAHGHVVHLGERECSLQRRHQKVVEEAPSPLVDDAFRAELGSQAVAAARACGYVNAGTVELLVDGERPGEPYFIEMNTRLQVEHPVTELVWGVDLVELQLRVAAGERLPFTQGDLAPRGHAVEARVYAESPAAGFLPSAGTVAALRLPLDHEHVRVDTGIDRGTVVGTTYDPMLAKVVAWAPDRDGALHRLDGALADVVVLGLDTNVGFLRALVRDAEVVAGRLDVGLVDRRLAELVPAPDLDRRAVIAAATTAALAAGRGRGRRAWRADGFRTGAAGETRFVAATTDGHDIALDGAPGVAARIDGDELVVTTGDCTERWLVATTGTTTWLGRDGDAWGFTLPDPRNRAGAAGAGGTTVASPMPGRVTALRVEPGATVRAGDVLVVVEAMKMEHSLRAEVDGTVVDIRCAAGSQVGRGDVLVVLEEGP